MTFDEFKKALWKVHKIAASQHMEKGLMWLYNHGCEHYLEKSTPGDIFLLLMAFRDGYYDSTAHRERFCRACGANGPTTCTHHPV